MPIAFVLIAERADHLGVTDITSLARLHIASSQFEGPVGADAIAGLMVGQGLAVDFTGAEHAAPLEVLSNGRVTLGLGMGYRPMEFDGLATAKRTRGARRRT